MTYSEDCARQPRDQSGAGGSMTPNNLQGDWLTGKDVDYEPEYESEADYIAGQ